MVAGFFCSARSKTRHKQHALELNRRANHGKPLFLFCVVCLFAIALLRFSPLLTEQLENAAYPSLSDYLPYTRNLQLLSANCNIFAGSWVYDSSYPLYEASSCPFVENGFQCRERGRLDIRYRQWRWQPRNCNIPRYLFVHVNSCLSGCSAFTPTHICWWSALSILSPSLLYVRMES